MALSPLENAFSPVLFFVAFVFFRGQIGARELAAKKRKKRKKEFGMALSPLENAFSPVLFFAAFVFFRGYFGD